MIDNGLFSRLQIWKSLLRLGYCKPPLNPITLLNPVASIPMALWGHVPQYFP